VNGKLSTALKYVIAAVGAIAVIVGALVYIGGELRALDDHLLKEHPNPATIEHIHSELMELKTEMKEFRMEVRDDIKDLRNELLYEHPTGP
jgi:hypothetical protein